MKQEKVRKIVKEGMEKEGENKRKKRQIVNQERNKMHRHTCRETQEKEKNTQGDNETDKEINMRERKNEKGENKRTRNETQRQQQNKK